MFVINNNHLQRITFLKLLLILYHACSTIFPRRINTEIKEFHFFKKQVSRRNDIVILLLSASFVAAAVFAYMYFSLARFVLCFLGTLIVL